LYNIPKLASLMESVDGKYHSFQVTKCQCTLTTHDHEFARSATLCKVVAGLLVQWYELGCRQHAFLC